jgi:hypothetical protein
MNLEEKIKDVEARLKNVESSVVTFKEELVALKGKTQPTNKQLLTDVSCYVGLNVGKDKYTHILGGDGRSMPWSEERTGDVASLRVYPMHYLSKDQIEMVKRWVNDVYAPDHIVFED